MLSINLIGAILVGLGGLVGYIKSGSLPSLGAGLTFAILIAIGDVLKGSEKTNFWTKFVFVTWAILALLMGFRFVSSWKFMPAGLMTVISITMTMINFSLMNG
eukprot:TRINITY_DN3171_c0_g3_i8.p1 TRINITY_DN3171_c0_g3~~TRINITY_DN3171_c0_g3_i8.p1  ORF type:complete len:103 (-),score=11.78 TRINITY_DN3171_c0_g3_i8:27-335(-)